VLGNDLAEGFGIFEITTKVFGYGTYRQDDAETLCIGNYFLHGKLLLPVPRCTYRQDDAETLCIGNYYLHGKLLLPFPRCTYRQDDAETPRNRDQQTSATT
jgi:hypothetical protein